MDRYIGFFRRGHISEASDLSFVSVLGFRKASIWGWFQSSGFRFGRFALGNWGFRLLCLVLEVGVELGLGLGQLRLGIAVWSGKFRSSG